MTNSLFAKANTTDPKIDAYFDQQVMRKYNTAGPRYTSYPTAVAFTELDTAEPHQDIIIDKALSQLSCSKDAQRLSLYMHVPFCHSLCYYCGCNKIVTRHAHKADIYLDYLIKEIQARGPAAKGCKVDSLHLGGGTPSFLNIAQLKRLLDACKKAFEFADKVEMSIEIDPREIELNYMDGLAKLGFSRLSIGVQDIDAKVQQSINRTQSTAFIRALIRRARQVGFKSVNLDLIYGLPHQTECSFQHTLEEMQIMRPDRISLFSYAHMPQLFAAQRKIKDEWLPNAANKFALFRQAVAFLTQIGYDAVGMDHFALPSDELSIAKREDRLFRNFQGYTTSAAHATLGLGVSSISSINDVYVQNQKDLKAYYQQMDEVSHAQSKGLVMSKDDLIRRALIHGLMCNFHINKATFSNAYDIDFDRYFEKSLSNLTTFIDDKLVTNSDEAITIHDRGRLIVRNICMSFDEYLDKPLHQMRYSRVI
uniref:oxygen-independent coproporphyrinogen III oxidase n=1 Tax=Ningiella ruwaisensis TaxID=2364274 RepID=UPI00109F65BA|nr:oxygen-independent coproporphyrinogen III oxidase [Ningiella ruwaisensis]